MHGNCFFLMLMDELHKVLNEVSNLCHAESGDCRVDHANDSGGKRPRVVVTSGWSVQSMLLGRGHGFGGLGFSSRGVDDFLSGRIKFGVLGAIGS